MKKLLMILLFILVITACTQAKTPEPQPTSEKTCVDWWSCAAETLLPEVPAFANWTRTAPKNLFWWNKEPRANPDEWRIERAGILWDQLCRIDGCPTVRDVSAWLLYHETEGGVTNDPYSMEIMVKSIRYKFTDETYTGKGGKSFTGDGMTIKDLSYFTTFINPQQDGSAFSLQDWRTLTRKPEKVYFELIDKYWTDLPFPIVAPNGTVVEQWLKYGIKPPYGWHWFYTGIDLASNKILVFYYIK